MLLEIYHLQILNMSEEQELSDGFLPDQDVQIHEKQSTKVFDSNIIDREFGGFQSQSPLVEPRKQLKDKLQKKEPQQEDKQKKPRRMKRKPIKKERKPIKKESDSQNYTPQKETRTRGKKKSVKRSNPGKNFDLTVMLLIYKYLKNYSKRPHLEYTISESDHQELKNLMAKNKNRDNMMKIFKMKSFDKPLKQMFKNRYLSRDIQNGKSKKQTIPSYLRRLPYLKIAFETKIYPPYNEKLGLTPCYQATP